MSEGDEGWVLLREFDTRIMADIAAEQLRASGIPVQIQDPSIGLFGPGFAGGSVHGVRLYVPTSRAAAAMELIAES
jgi:hypothetical protein